MPQLLLPAWASTAVGNVLTGPWRQGHVLASAGVACYLAVPVGGQATDLIALLRPEAVRLPMGICVRGELPDDGDEIRLGHGLVAAATRSWRPVRWWDPRPRLSADGMLRHRAALLDTVLQQPPSAFGLAVADALAVAHALAAGRPEPALAVIGLGPGLTPAGDDVVAGALAVLALTARLHDSTRKAINARAATHTTTLSAALLAAAGRGQMIPQAARLLTMIASGAPPARVRVAAGELFGVGSTSGHDLCAGMAGALAGLRGATRSPAAKRVRA